MSAHDNPFQTGYTVAGGGSAAASAPAAADAVKDVTTASFTADVIQASREVPVLVDFWAPWCGPCRQLAPVLEKVVAEAAGRVRLVKMNIDDHPSIAGQFGIQSIPAVIAFSGGQPVDGFMGALPESKIREFIDRIAGADGASDAVTEALAAAGDMRAQGDAGGAAQLYARIIEAAPDNLDALAGLAETLSEAGDTVAAGEVLARVPAEAQDDPRFDAVKARLALAEQVAGLGDPAELERRLAADPADHQARFDLALIQNALGERDKAADSLLAIMKADREWQEDAARLQLLKLFEAWGMTDKATLAARRKLSSLLFS